MIHLITGGERSGKSDYAQKFARKLSSAPVYIATSRIWDDDFEKRVNHHRNRRDAHWTTIEEEKYLSKIDLHKKVAVIDCITLWLTNYWVDTKYDLEESLQLAKHEIDLLRKIDCTLILITNEIGMGVHASSQQARKFVELQGWVNQYIAKYAEKVTFMVSGIPIQIKI